jgi:hypothetical protein
MALIASLISCADGGQTVEPAVENAPRLALKLAETPSKDLDLHPPTLPRH